LHNKIIKELGPFVSLCLNCYYCIFYNITHQNGKNREQQVVLKLDLS